MKYLAAEFCQGFGDPKGTLGKLLEFKNAHGTIPDDGLGICQSSLEGLQ